MATRSTIARQTADGYRSITCHWDGDLEGVGATLQAHYCNPAKIDQLLALGDLSTLGAEIGQKHQGETGWCVAYGREHNELGSESRDCATLAELAAQAEGDDSEFLYLWSGDRWTVATDPDGRGLRCWDRQPLAAALLSAV